jgi:hypothetical protein
LCDAHAETGTEHSAATADRYGFAGRLIAGRLCPAALCHDWFHFENMVDPFRNYQWLFVVIMPFGLIMVDLQGFINRP